MGKYKACKAYDDVALKEYYWVEKTDERYGYPAVLIPQHPLFWTFEEAQDFAKKLNKEKEQLKLF